jgi:hypothetical protein
MRRAAIEFSQAHRGATARTMTVIGEFWEAKQD